jgi:AcrR family transcriptional regulator
MGEQERLTKRRGPYRLRARAEAMERTRQRIADAAVDLHGTIGPAATTMSAVAERAGVTRATLYRHFPTEEALFGACSRAWLAAHPRPDVARWRREADPQRRIRLALREMYAYYRSARAMLANLMRDIAALPDATARNLASYPGQMLDALDAGWSHGSDDRLRRAGITHAVAFDTWRSLADGGLSDEEAAELMTSLVVSVGDPAPADGASGPLRVAR